MYHRYLICLFINSYGYLSRSTRQFSLVKISKRAFVCTFLLQQATTAEGESHFSSEMQHCLPFSLCVPSAVELGLLPLIAHNIDLILSS